MQYDYQSKTYLILITSHIYLVYIYIHIIYRISYIYIISNSYQILMVSSLLRPQLNVSIPSWNAGPRCRLAAPVVHMVGLPSGVIKHGVLETTLSGWWLSPTPLKNMSSSVGMMTFPIYGKIKHVPNHQPAIYRWFSELSYPHGPISSGFPSLPGLMTPLRVCGV